MIKRLAGLTVVIVSSLLVSPVAQTPPPEIVLTAQRGPAPTELTLRWTGGQPSFEVYRSADVSAVCHPDNLLGVTSDQSWIDPMPPGAVFYKVRSPFAYEPPEVCNGVDDDCDGSIDEDATGCNASACEACIGGRCQTQCGACDNCVGGVCQTRCAACQTCVNGTCGSCNPVQCQVCVNGVCQSSCDDSQCLTCTGAGVCISFCASCETCTAGICMDACDRDHCLSCQSGSCQPFCDPICQTCTPMGCADNCGPCQRCVSGACQSRCDPNACEECIDGFCQSRCAPGESCVGGTCDPSSSAGEPGLDGAQPG